MTKHKQTYEVPGGALVHRTKYSAGNAARRRRWEAKDRPQ